MSRAGVAAQRRQPVLRPRADPAAPGTRCRTSPPRTSRPSVVETLAAGWLGCRRTACGCWSGPPSPAARSTPACWPRASDPTRRPSSTCCWTRPSAGVVTWPAPPPRFAHDLYREAMLDGMAAGHPRRRSTWPSVARLRALGRPGAAAQVAAHLLAAGPDARTRGVDCSVLAAGRRPHGSATTTPADHLRARPDAARRRTTERARLLLDLAAAQDRAGRRDRPRAALREVARRPGAATTTPLLARAALGLQLAGRTARAPVAEVIELLADADRAARRRATAPLRCGRGAGRAGPRAPAQPSATGRRPGRRRRAGGGTGRCRRRPRPLATSLARPARRDLGARAAPRSGLPWSREMLEPRPRQPVTATWSPRPTCCVRPPCSNSATRPAATSSSPTSSWPKDSATPAGDGAR